MNHKDFRVDLVPGELVQDPPHPTPSKELVKALQNDILETAKVLRDALYDLHKNYGLTGGLSYRLEKALTTLDFPHFIPIENTGEALYLEYVSLQNLVAWADLDDDEAYQKDLIKLRDIENELDRRDFWSEIVLADMTAVSLSIEPGKSEKSELCQFPKSCETTLCGWILCPFHPIENTSEALASELNRLDNLFWQQFYRSESTNKTRLQFADIHDELSRRDIPKGGE